MARSLTGAVVAVLLLQAVGCVSQAQHDQLREAWRRSQEQVVERDTRISDLEKEKARLAATKDNSEEVDALKSENDKLMAKLKASEGRYKELEKRIAEVELIQIAPELNDALKDFATQHGDLVTYDAKRSMLRFRSDLTFSPGSDVLSANAQMTLTELAKILVTPAAAKYEVKVVGHTDAVPIAKSRAQHPTNWHLSVHRSISVQKALEEAGVPALRTSVAGHGMYRPMEQNTMKGTEKNRRVELYLVPLPEVNEKFLERVE